MKSIGITMQPGSTFAITFMLVVISAAGILSLLPPHYLSAFCHFTILLTQGVGAILGIPISSNGDILTVNGFAMRIITQCTAVDYLVIIAAAMLLYTRHRLAYRLIGVTVAIPLILLANAGRLLMTGIIGAYSPSAFEFVHDYLWVVGFALLVFALWSLWVNGSFQLSRSGARRIAVVTCVSLTTYLVMFLFQEAYSGLLARNSSLFYSLLYHDPEGSIVRAGNGVAYVRGGATLYLSSYMEQLNVAVYVGLMTPLQRRGDLEMFGTTLLGLIAMFLTGSIFLAIGCGYGVASGEGALVEFLKAGSFVQLALPLAVYWILSGEREKRDAAVANTGKP
jgi:exosortase/archaeosortase family protein